MTAADHNKILAIGFAVFAAIYLFTFLLLLLVTTGVFVGMGVSMSNETGDDKQLGIGLLGGAFTVIFYSVLGLICVLPTALASWKLFRRKPGARFWAAAGAIVILPVMPLGTALGVYALWWLFSAEGKQYYLNNL